MTLADVFPVLAATWPPAQTQRVGPFLVPLPDLGGNRVSAARLADPAATTAAEVDLALAEQAMQAQDRAPLFMVLDHQTGLAAALDARGYHTRDHTDVMVIEAAALAAIPPSVTAFDIWPPLAIQTEIWANGGIDAARLAIMHRATCPKTSLFGRINDQPAGTAFIGMQGDIAMLHALEIAAPARRRGLAAHMMRAAAQWAVENGASWLSILVTQQNNAAQGLYASLGMRPVGTYTYREKAKEGGKAS